MKRIASLALRDFRSSVRDFIAIYIIVAPFVIAFIIAGFVPSTEDASVVILVDDSVTEDVIASLEDYVAVDTYDSRGAMEARINATDERIGLSQHQIGGFEIVTEGNEQGGTETLLISLLNRYETEKNGSKGSHVTIDYSDIGVTISPVAIIGLVSIALVALVLGGMVVSMNIIEEKESMTFAALNTTPLTRSEFIIGKSLAGAIIAVVQVVTSFYIFGFSNVDFLKVLFISVSGLGIVVIMGFILGLVSENQMAAMANMKVLFLPISITIIGALMMLERLHILLWWSPFYWIYDGMTKIIMETATWGGLLVDALGVIVITLLVYGAFRKKINANLQSV